MSEVLRDGFLIDDETGEVLGHVELKEEAWTPTTRDEVNWVLGLFADVDANLVGVQVRIAAQLANIKKQEAAAQAKRNWLFHRFGSSVKSFGEIELSHNWKYKDGRDWPKKSLVLDNGTLKFMFPTENAVPKIRVAEDAEELDAILYLEHAFVQDDNGDNTDELLYPGAVKTEKSILVSMLKGKEADLPDNLFELEWPVPKFDIVTGVVKKEPVKRGPKTLEEVDG